MDLERARGRTRARRRGAAPLGFISDFYVVGGFDNEGKAGCDTDFGPEAAALDLAAKYPAPRAARCPGASCRSRPRTGYVDLAAAVRPNRRRWPTR